MQPKTIKSKNNNIFENIRRSHFFLKEGDLHCFENGRHLKKKCNQKQLKVKAMVVAPLRVT